MRKLVWILVIVPFFAGCAMPVTSVHSVDTRPSISVKNAGTGAELFVDGVRMGRASDYNEPYRLNLDAGTHRISIVEKGQTVFQQTIFIESEHKTIIVQ